MPLGWSQAPGRRREPMGLWEAAVFLLVTALAAVGGQTCNNIIPFDINGPKVTFSSTTSASTSTVWCPDTARDPKPFIEFIFDPAGQLALCRVNATTEQVGIATGYASTYSLYVTLPLNTSLNGTYQARQNIRAVGHNDPGIITYYLTLVPPVAYKTLRFEPLSSYDESGGMCMSLLFQGCNTSDLCPAGCQNGGTCGGQDYCYCPPSFYGAICSLTAEDVLQSTARLRLVSAANWTYTFSKARFSSSVSLGVSVNFTQIDLKGAGAYLYAAKDAVDKPFKYLLDPMLSPSFNLFFAFRVAVYNQTRPVYLLATNAIDKVKGVNIWIQSENGTNVLKASLRTDTKEWNITGSSDVLQTTGKWVTFHLNWDVSFGMEVRLDGQVVGRALWSYPKVNSDSSYLCLGYPSYGYDSYDNDISIRDLTVFPSSRREILTSIQESASSLRIQVANGTVSSQQLGSSLAVSSSNGLSVDVTGTQLSLTGSNVYLTATNPSAPYDALIQPGRYTAFTVSFSFSVVSFNASNYIIGTSYRSNHTGVNVYLLPSLLFVVEINAVNFQWRMTYTFSQNDVARLTGQGVTVAISNEDSIYSLYIDNILRARAYRPDTTYTLNAATAVCFGFPSSTYSESAVSVGLRIWEFKIWRVSWFYLQLPKLPFDDFLPDVTSLGNNGSDVASNTGAEAILQSTSRLRLVSANNESYTFNKARFSSSVTHGVSVNFSQIHLNGTAAYLYAAKDGVDKPFDCLLYPELYTSFSLFFAFQLRALSKTRPTYLLATNALTRTKGVAIWINFENSSFFLKVVLRREDREWSINASSAALKISNEWVSLQLSWDVSVGLEVSLDGQLVGRAITSYPSVNADATYLCLGYPSYGYESYDNDISIRDLTVFPSTSQRILTSIQESASSLRIQVANGTVSSQQLGSSLAVSSSNGLSVDVTGTQLSLTGSNVYLTATNPSAPYDALIQPGRYTAFTVSFSFSVVSFNASNYIIGTSYRSNHTGVNVYLLPSLLFVVEINAVNFQWRMTYTFSQNDVARLTGQGVTVAISNEDSIYSLYIDNILRARAYRPDTTYTLNAATAVCFGFPSSTYSESAVSVGLRIWEFKIWRVSWFYLQLPKLPFDDFLPDVTSLGNNGSDVASNTGAEAILQSTSRLRLVSANNESYTFNKARFSSSVTHGVSVNFSQIHLNGTAAYLYAAKDGVDKPFDCLLYPELYTSFSLFFAFQLRALSKTRPTYLLATNALTRTKGVAIWINFENSSFFLKVVLRREDREWSINASSAALKISNEWVSLQLSWDVSVGLEVSLDGQLVGRAITSYPSVNADATYLCLGYPSYGYESYDNDISIRDLTVFPSTSQRILTSIQESASSLRIQVANGTVSSQQLGSSLAVSSSNGLSVDVTGTRFSLTGSNVYLTATNPSAPYDALIQPGRYTAFTVSFSFSVVSFNASNYIIGTSYRSNHTGVNVYLLPSLLFVVEINAVNFQWRMTYTFSQNDVARLTGQGVTVAISNEDSIYSLYIDNILRARAYRPDTTYTLNAATAVCFGFPSSTYSESAVSVGLRIWEFKIWRVSWFYLQLPKLPFDDFLPDVTSLGNNGSDVASNTGAEAILQSTSRLRLVSANNESYTFNKARFSSSVTHGVSVNFSQIHLNGTAAYLYAAKDGVDKPFDCLLYPELYTSFSLFFAFQLRALSKTRPTYLLATNALTRTKGVAIWINFENSSFFLKVVLRREDREWSINASSAALKISNEWVSLQLSWDVSVGLEVSLDGQLVGRAITSYPSVNADATYLCLGYPSYGYESYDNDISIRDLTVFPSTSQRILTSIQESASSLRIQVANGTVSSQQLGSSLAVSSSNGLSVDVTGTRFSLTGSNVYLTATNPSAPYDALIQPGRYTAFTVSFSFSVVSFNASNYIIGTSYRSNHTGVNVYLLPSLLFVVEINAVNFQWRMTYTFSQNDVARLTGQGVTVAISNEDSTYSLYIDNILRARVYRPDTTYTLNAATAVCFGFPSSTYSESAVSVGLRIWEFKIWRVSWFYLQLPNLPYDEVLPDVTTPYNNGSAPSNTTDGQNGQGETPSDYQDDIQDNFDVEICFGVIARRQAEVFRLLVKALLLDTLHRTPVCSDLATYVARSQVILTSCWRAAEVGNDSISQASFLHYSQKSLFAAFSTAHTVICGGGGALPPEPTGKCDLTAIQKVLTSFFSASLAIGQGEQQCSLLWTERERLTALSTVCGATTKAVLGELSAESLSMVEMACSSPTCSVDYAQRCAAAAEEALMSVNGTRASQEVCMDVKVSLACVTNHTLDCSGVQYLSLSERTRSLYARYRDSCDVEDRPAADLHRLNVQDAQLLMQAGAVYGIFPTPLLCSLWSKEEWMGQDVRISVSPLADSYVQSMCDDVPEASTCSLAECLILTCGDLRTCVPEKSKACGELKDLEVIISLQNDYDVRCGGRSNSSLLVSTKSPALDKVVQCFRLIRFDSLTGFCQGLAPLRSCVAGLQGDDDILLSHALRYVDTIADSIDAAICTLPDPSANETGCYAAYRALDMVLDAVTVILKGPLLPLSRREERCRLFIPAESWTGCNSSSDQYFRSMLSAAEDLIEQTCQRMPPSSTCDMKEAQAGIGELISSFLLPTSSSACSLIDSVEVHVRRATIGCRPLQAWPISSAMGKLREMADSTCYKGKCDPAGAVVCLIDVHHMARMPVPDWEGVCSMLNDSSLCAKEHVLGCDKCQRDTVDTIVAKVNQQLEDKCRAPPPSLCRAVQAYKCKDVLLEFEPLGSPSDSNSTEGVLCLRIFEARECARKLTMECDNTYKLAVSVDLEAVIKELKAVTCDEKEVIRDCRNMFSQFLNTVLAYDPLDPEDPSYAQSTPAGNASDVGAGSGESGWQEISFVKTYLGHQCQQLFLAYECALEGLRKFPIEPAVGFEEVLNTSWSLAWVRCKAATKPLKCFTCTDANSNEECDDEEEKLCPPDRQMCHTRVVRDSRYQNVTINKGCIAPLDCRPGNDGIGRTFCCDGAGCNQPDNGPVPGTCSLLRVAECLNAVTDVMLKTNSVSCGMIIQQRACIDFVHQECTENGVTEVSDALSGFLNSSVVTECQVEVSDSRCGLYAATALSSLLATASDSLVSSDLCPMLAAVEWELRLAVFSGKCDADEIMAVNKSYTLLRSQLWDLKCDNVTEIMGTCQPFTALGNIIENLNETLPVCGLNEVWEDFSNLTAACHPMQMQLLQQYIFLLPDKCRVNFPSIPSPPVDVLLNDSCLSNFRDELIRAMTSSSAEELQAVVERFLQCHISTWTMEFYFELPPSYRVYIYQIIIFINNFWDSFFTSYGDNVIPSNVSESCRSSQEKAAKQQAVQMLQMIFRPFSPVSDINAFCSLAQSMEVQMATELKSKCQISEMQLQLNLIEHLQEYRMTVCPIEEPLPSCSVSSASECIVTFTAFMDTAEIEEEEMCSSLNLTFECVRSYTATCSPFDIEEVNRDLLNIAVLYRDTCPEVIAPLCEVSSSLSLNASHPVTILDECGTATGSYSCSFLRDRIRCYKEAAGSLGGLQDRLSPLKNNYPLLDEFGKYFCGLNLESWTVDEQCTEPKCSITDIDFCFTFDTSSKEIDDTLGQILLSNASQCLQERFFGCDVVVRSEFLHKVRVRIDAFIIQHNLNITWDLFGFIGLDVIPVTLIVKFFEKLEVSIRQPEWDLLSLCWDFDDLLQTLRSVVDGDNGVLLKQLLKHPIHALDRSLSLVCNDPSIIGVILNLPDKEDDMCPQEAFQTQMTSSLVQTIFAGFQPRKKRQQLCQILESWNSFDVTACSAGFQLQVQLLKTVFEYLTDSMCSVPSYCSPKKARRCVSEMVAVVQGIGTSSSKEQVCSSIDILDQCVTRFSARCNSRTAAKIAFSVESVRGLAVSICSENVSDSSPATCTVQTEKGVCKRADARRCSVKQLLDLFAPVSDSQAHCRALVYTEDCYDRLTEACEGVNGKFTDLAVSFPSGVLQGLQDRLDCHRPEVNIPAPVVCTAHCNVSQATICIDTLESKLAVFSPSGADQEDACLFISTARQCLVNQTSNCTDDTSKAVYSRLDDVMMKYSTIAKSCVDIYSCLSDLSTVTTRILAATSISLTGAYNASSMGEVSLDVLCDQAITVQQCVTAKLGRLSAYQYKWINPIVTPLLDLLEGQCSATVKLRCYHCNGAILEGKNNVNDKCSNDRACGQKQTRCYEYFEEEERTGGSTDVLVYRGCMEPQECQQRKGENGFYCCATEHCNNGTNVVKEPEQESDSCYNMEGVTCALNYVNSLVRQDTVQCSSALKDLQCVVNYTQACDGGEILFEAASQLMLTLSQTTCVSGPLSPLCSPIAVLSMDAVLSNAFAVETACIAWQQANQSLSILELQEKCTPVDFATIQESLSFASIIVHTTCNPQDCQVSNSTASSGGETSDQDISNAGSDELCNYYGASKCGRDALSKLKAIDYSNQELACSEVKADATCAVEILENCEIESPCLKKLILQVQEESKEKCGEDFFDPPEPNNTADDSLSQDATCKPSIMCNLEEAMACADRLYATWNNSNDTCRSLQEAAKCRSESVKSCRSMQSSVTLTYFNEILEAVSRQCPEVNLNLNPVKDVYSGASACVEAVLSRMYEGIGGGEEEPVNVFCSAAVTLTGCEFTVPDLNKDFAVGDFTDLFNTVSKGLCLSNSPSQPGREKRENGSSSWEIASALNTVVRSFFFSIIPLDSRQGMCKRVHGALQTLDSYLGNIPQLGLSIDSQTVLLRFQAEGWNQFTTYCDNIRWEPTGCRPEYFQTCMESFWKLSSLAQTENDTHCRITAWALQCLGQFSVGCDDTAVREVQAARFQVQAVIGNTCPNLTLGLFCPSKYSVVNNFTCSYSSAQKCLSEVNTNVIDRRFENYCPNLDKSLSCGKNGLEGCLQSEVDAAVNISRSKRNLNQEVGYCRISTSVVDYSSVCIAKEPCSVINALSCFEDKEVADCGSLTTVRSCVESSLQNCNNTQPVATAVSLFIRKFIGLQQQCPSLFVNLPSVNWEHFALTNTLVQNLTDSLVTVRSKRAVCKAFYAYLDALANMTGQEGALSAAVNYVPNFLQPVLDAFCPGDKNGELQEQPAECQIQKAAFCLVVEMTWPLASALLPTTDNQEFCGRWKEQSVRSCVNKNLVNCGANITELFVTAMELSSRIVVESATCEPVSLCIKKEAYHYINELSVAVSNYAINNNTVTLCLQKSKAESHVGAFSAACKDTERAIVSASLAQVTGLVMHVCDSVELPPQPLCPELPAYQRTCSVGKAFTCIVNLNSEMLKQYSTFIYWDICSSMQDAMHCAAFNTSGCDPSSEDMKAVSLSLNHFRNQTGDRCPWLTPDFCSVMPDCPEQYSPCSEDFRMNLINKPLEDPCSLLESAEKCLADNTATCTRAQRAVAKDAMERRVAALPSLKCGTKEVVPCLLRAQAATWQQLNDRNVTENNGPLNIANITGCLEGKNTTSPSVQVAIFLDGVIRQSFNASQVAGASCGQAVALTVNSVYEWILQMAASSEFDHGSFCSKRSAILADIEVNHQLFNQSCPMPVLDALEAELRNGQEGSQCDGSSTECSTVLSNARKCLTDFDAIQDCNAATELAMCLKLLGVCSEAERADLTRQYEERVSVLDVCDRMPLILVATSPSTKHYISEQGGSVSIHYKIAENYSTYFTSDANSSDSLVIRLRTKVSSYNPPRCMSSDEAEIPQLVVKSDRINPCGTLVTTADWISQYSGSIELMAALDGRQDDTQEVNVTVYVEVLQKIPPSSSWSSYAGPFTLAQYTVAVENTDSPATVCTSIGYTQIQTFDGTVFNNFQSGTYLFYANKVYGTFVTMQVVRTSFAAVCTCACTVGNADVSVEFNRCPPLPSAGPPKEISVTMTKTGDYSQIAVYRGSNLNSYYVVLGTGTYVTVKKTGNCLGINIMGSPLDTGKTVGICGLFDGNAYNDLVLRDGQRYTTQANDLQYGALSPSGFLQSWSVTPEEFSEIMSSLTQDIVPTCKCMDSSPDLSQCGYTARVSTCDYVQGEDITSALAAASEQIKSAASGRRRRAVDASSPDALSPASVPGWPTPSNWTQAMAKEHCEKVLLEATNLRDCDKAILTANGSFSYADIFTMCVEEIRVFDKAANLTSITKHAEYLCLMLFVRNTTYFSLDSVRDTVLKFLDTTCIPANCNGHGQCQQGVCVCFPGYVGGDCAYRYTNLPVPTNASLVYGNLCYITNSNPCEDIFISADRLVESPHLSCHIQEAEVDHSGIYRHTGSLSVTKAQLVTETVARCSLSRTNPQMTVAVAISNNGVNSSAAMLFSAFDPHCYTCSSSNNYCEKWAQNACQIQGRCYLGGETTAADNCTYCNPGQSATVWTYRVAPECKEWSGAASAKDLMLTVNIIVIVSCVTAFAVIVTAAVGIICRRRLRRKAKENKHSPGSFMDLPPDYVSSQLETSFVPQEVFAKGNLHTRAVTQAGLSIPRVQHLNQD